MGEHGAAAAHFQRVLRSEGAAPLHDGAALAAALAELQGDPEVGAGGPLGGVRAGSKLLAPVATVAALPSLLRRSNVA